MDSALVNVEAAGRALEALTKPDLELVKAYDGTSQDEKGEVNVCTALITAPQASEAF